MKPEQSYWKALSLFKCKTARACWKTCWIMSLLCVLTVNDWTALLLYCQTPLSFHANDIIVMTKGGHCCLLSSKSIHKGRELCVLKSSPLWTAELSWTPWLCLHLDSISPQRSSCRWTATFSITAMPGSPNQSGDLIMLNTITNAR